MHLHAMLSHILAVASVAGATDVNQPTWNGEPWQVGSGGDPAGSWLSYAVYTAPAGSLITQVNTSWNVPVGKPTKSGSNAPGWWYGLQTAKGNGALVQPILACDYKGSSCKKGTYKIFDGVYDWTTPMHGMYESKVMDAAEGDKINSWISCTEESCTQYIENARTGEGAEFPYTLHNKNKDDESVLYFVLEHQPRTCDAYPPNGVVVFEDIYVEVDGQAVTPEWTAVQEKPACGSQATVIDSKTLAITWNGGTPPAPTVV